MRRRGWILAGAIGLTVACAPGAAASTPRYASVAGSGTACTAAAPCSLEAAVNGTGANPASAHDEIVVTPGTYGSSGSPTPELQDAAGRPLTIHGVAGSPRPVIYANNVSSAITLFDPGSTLSHLEFRQVAAAGGHAINLIAGSATDVVANALGTNGVACGVLGTLRESVCAAFGPGGSAIEASAGGTAAQTFSPSVRGVTAWALGATSDGLLVLAGANTTIGMQVTNTIAHGTSEDVRAQSGATTGTANVALDHSSYATATHSPTRATVTPAGSATNVGAAQLLDPASSDFHEKPSSPTVDAGAADPPGTDVYGLPRTLGSAPDIGAAELAQAPMAAATGALDVTDKTATLTGIINPEGLATSYRFLYGTTPGTGSHTATVSAGAVAAGHAVTARLTGLRAGKTYFVRLAATSAGGTTVSPLSQFTTLTSFKGLTIRSRRVRPDARHRVKIAVACPKDAPKRCTGTLTLSGGGGARFNVKAGKRGRVTITLGTRARAALGKHATVKVRATAKAKDGVGRKKTTKRSLTLAR